MTFKVVNTIQLPGVDFGKDLLKTLDAEFIEGPGRTEDEIIAIPMFRMCDQTIGVLGFGKIGTATALNARGLGTGP